MVAGGCNGARVRQPGATLPAECTKYGFRLEWPAGTDTHQELWEYCSWFPRKPQMKKTVTLCHQQGRTSALTPLEAVEEGVNQDADEGVSEGGDGNVAPTPAHGLAQ